MIVNYAFDEESKIRAIEMEEVRQKNAING